MEVTDAYQEYIERRREAGSAIKIATLTLSEADMASVGYLVSDALEQNGESLSKEDQRRWVSILRSIETAVKGAG